MRTVVVPEVSQTAGGYRWPEGEAGMTGSLRRRMLSGSRGEPTHSAVKALAGPRVSLPSALYTIADRNEAQV